MKQRFVFLTLAEYSFIAVSAVTQALQTVNRLLGHAAYEWVIASVDGKPVVASNGLAIEPTMSIANVGPADAIFVCGGTNIQRAVTPELVNVLRHSAIRQTVWGGLCTGAYALAKVGLLNQCRAAIHWENRFSAQELFPAVQFTDKLFVIDKNRYTCAGGTASLYLALRLIEDRLGAAIAVAVSEHFGLDRIRDEHERQCTPMQARVGVFQSNLIEIAELMEANIAEPLSMNEIAALVGISRRQLERLFKRYVGEIPTKYYMNLRLRHARDLVLQTSMSITEIAMACGFVNGAYFSRCFREAFGCSPRDQRSTTRSVSGVEQQGRKKPASISLCRMPPACSM